MPLLTVSHLRKRFNLEAGFFARFGRFVNAVNDVSFSIGANETYGLVGESGCGKTTTARLLVRMYEADGGSILYHRSLWGFSPNDKKNAQFCAFSTLQTPKGAQKSGVFAVKGRK
ncbi:MAG: ATP-binding cassette domain-containing protein, partial [Treponema sp.]|nr:ATP-binding cassette domain-containing protein [Treponema sp.]